MNLGAKSSVDPLTSGTSFEGGAVERSPFIRCFIQRRIIAEQVRLRGDYPEVPARESLLVPPDPNMREGLLVMPFTGFHRCPHTSQKATDDGP